MKKLFLISLLFFSLVLFGKASAQLINQTFSATAVAVGPTINISVYGQIFSTVAPIISEQPITSTGIVSTNQALEQKNILAPTVPVMWQKQLKANTLYHVRVVQITASGKQFVTENIKVTTGGVGQIFYKTLGKSDFEKTGTNEYKLTGLIDISKHKSTDIVPLSTIKVTGFFYDKNTGQSILSIGPAVPKEDGKYEINILTNGILQDNTDYGLKLIFSSPVGAKTEYEVKGINTQKGYIIPETGKEAEDFLNKNSYRLLAPIPGMTMLLDPELCKLEQAKNPGEICDINAFLNFILQLAIGAAAVVLVVRIIIDGYGYMITDVPFIKAKLKGRFLEAMIGLVIALSSYLILNTVSPKLVSNDIKIGVAEFDVEVFNRADDPVFTSRLSSFNTSGITTDLKDPTFLGYLSHQQGVAGASAILWAASNDMATVSSNNPFTSSNVNTNMRSNFNKQDAQKTIGTSTLTPINFLKYWSVKVEAVKRSSKTSIPNNITSELKRVSQETGVDLLTLQTFCQIESGCTTNSLTVVNKYGYAGLFQLSNGINQKQPGIWEQYKKPNGNLFSAYDNGYVAAKLFLYHMSIINKNLTGVNLPKTTTTTTGSKTLLVMGDSNTASGVYSPTYIEQFAKQNNSWSLNNRAVGGKTTIWMLDQMKSIENEGKRYNTIVIMGGTNDILSGFNQQNGYKITEKNLGEMIKIAKKISDKVVVISPPTTTKNVYPSYTTLQQQISDLESLNRYLSSYPGIIYVDFFTKTKNTPSLLRSDGVHLTTQGQQALLDLISQKI